MGTRVKREEDHVAGILFQLDIVSLTVSIIGRHRDFEQAMHSFPLRCFVRSTGDLRSVFEKGVIAHYQFDVRQSERFENETETKIYPDWTRLDEWLDKPDEVDDRER
jgi:hypothetical protein